VDLKEIGIVVWTAFKWDMEDLKVSAWMHDEVVSMMKSEDWGCTLVQVDTWGTLFTEPPLVKDVVEKGMCWV
jgi:hypothetical protein